VRLQLPPHVPAVARGDHAERSQREIEGAAGVVVHFFHLKQLFRLSTAGGRRRLNRGRRRTRALKGLRLFQGQFVLGPDGLRGPLLGGRGQIVAEDFDRLRDIGQLLPRGDGAGWRLGMRRLHALGPLLSRRLRLGDLLGEFGFLQCVEEEAHLIPLKGAVLPGLGWDVKLSAGISER